MKHFAVITSTLLFSVVAASSGGSLQSAAKDRLTEALTQKASVTGRIVLYDASMALGTSNADFILRQTGDKKLVRLLYSPYGFAFDAPRASKDQLLPRQVYKDGKEIWTFIVHSPKTPEEQSACTSVRKRYAPGKNGTEIEAPRYTQIPNAGEESSLQPDTATCLLVDSWKKVGRTSDKNASGSARPGSELGLVDVRNRGTSD